ncbi:MAG TPA: flagellar filament capping protein FliD [Burkholderiaceae bacterium]|nr:flagellar filament capping protein FliD [Burkholderiaceae bacterium]
MSVSGVGGGNLDVAGIVEQLMTIERRPLQSMQKEQRDLNTKISALGSIQSQLSALRDAARKLSTPSALELYKVDAGDGKVATASTTGSVAAGSYALTVASLASNHALVTARQATGATLGTGSLTIELGSMATGSFVPTGSSTTINISGGTLAEIRDAINGSNAGVTASIIRDGDGQRLSLSSKTSGAAGMMRISVTDSDGNNTDSSGLSALAFNPGAAVGAGRNLTQTQAAADASYTLNGVPLTAASNTITDAIDGLTINLRSVSATPVNLDVKTDTDGIRKLLDDFVKAYNTLNSTLNTQTRYDAGSKNAGTLQGQRVAVGAMDQLRAMVRLAAPGAAAGSSSSGGLFDIARDGTLSIKSAGLENALKDMNSFKTLMSADGTQGNAGSQGVADRFVNLVNRLLGSDGAVTTQLQGWRDSVNASQRRQDAFTDRLATTEERLRRQYANLDTQLSNINAQLNPISQLVNSLGR